jgi:hypothetical protein
VSAQIITALRKRAEALDAEADDLDGQRIDHVIGIPGRTAKLLRFTATEFRALADQAEAR